MKLEFPRQFSKNTELFNADGRRDEWTEMKITVALCNFANVLKMCRFILHGLVSYAFIRMSNYYKSDRSATGRKDKRVEGKILNLKLASNVIHEKFTSSLD